MVRGFQVFAYSSSFVVAVGLSASLGACSVGGTGSVCMSSADCDDDFVCVFGGDASSGNCIDPDEDHGAFPQPGFPSQLSVNKDVDILFVIDNSGSMGEEQAILANNVGSFISVLEANDVEANYRIGVTTTDNGNPWCPPGTTTPEAGELVLSSCKDRINDFLFNNGAVDVQDLACNDICTLTSAELEILPTTTDVDVTPKPRPWLENIEGVKNIPASTSTIEAFKCFGPQGINGCGFESPLESMYISLKRAVNTQEANYGFLRSNAILAVVLVTDEADCSYNKDWAEIFEQDGLKTFWTDPNAAFPTSAVCWNAGVECEGDPSNYSACIAVDKNVNGGPAASDADAVLHPMSRYIGLLDDFESGKQELNAEQEVIVALIAGVGNDGLPFYADVSATDPDFQNSFGIGPGCTAPPATPGGDPVEAVPPVRLRELVDAFSEGNMFSVCNGDYSGALEAIAVKIRDQIQPACYASCVADTDAATPVLDPDCDIEEDPPGNNNGVAVPECARDASGYLTDESGDFVMPSDDANVCHALLIDDPDEPLTGSSSDDLSMYCADRSYNLEIKIARRPGYPAVGGTSISASCALAEFPAVSCPGIGG